ncbi:DNA helicase RecG, partial [Elusimicrobiota bacterium]
MKHELDQNIRYIKGVGDVRARLLNKLGITTVKDLISHFPVRHEDRRNIKKIAMVNDGETTVVRGKVTRVDLVRIRGRKKL